MIKNDHTKEAKQVVSDGIIRALEAMGLQAESYAKLELENDPRRIDTGRLRNSISHTVNSSDQSVAIGTNTEYAVYVHEGTDRMAPNRFLRNALEKHQPEYNAIAQAMIKPQ